MANPQLENGYTRIANEILEAMAKVKLSPTQYRVLFVVWRYTYGFSRKSADLSLTFLANATGCDARSIQRELKRLIEWNILIEYPSGKQTRHIGFNKYYTQWTVGNSAIGETTIGRIANGETANSTLGETANSTLGETANQERKYIKKYIKKDIKKAAEQFSNKIEQAYLNAFGTLITPHNHSMICGYLEDGLTEWHICEALRRTAESNGRNFKYTIGILNHWLNQRAFTKEAVERLDSSFSAKKSLPDSGSGRRRYDPEAYRKLLEEAGLLDESGTS